MKKGGSLASERQIKNLWTVIFTVLAVAYIIPVITVLINSFKLNTFVKTDTFAIPNKETFAGWANFITGMTFGNYPFWKSAL